MKSWKTTLCGCIAGAAAYLAKDASLSPVVHQIAEVVACVALAAMGTFSRDNSVSSEAAGVKQ